MNENTCPLEAPHLLDRYFLESRARVLELAAFLDRVDRARDPETARQDFRYRALIRAIGLLVEAGGGRAAAVLEALSDPTSGLRETSSGLGPAAGAWKGDGP